VNPPGNPKASYYEGGPVGAGPQAWLEGATQRKGSWWEAWAAWELERSGEERRAPKRPGNARYAALEPAPGSYVVDRPQPPGARGQPAAPAAAS